jgi:DNA-binding transcriptional LysR family regulator
MNPTPKAHAVAPMVRQAIALLERGLSELRSFDPTSSDRQFRLGLAELGESLIFPHLVARLARVAPQVTLRSVRGSRAKLPAIAARREVDLALDFLPPVDPTLRHRRIADEELVTIARIDHPRIRGSITIEQFFAEAHVGVDLDAGGRAKIAELAGSSALQRRMLCTCAHYSSVPNVVMQTDAIATVPRAFLSLPLYAGRLQVLASPLPLFKLPVFVYWHESLEADPGHLWLRGQVLRRFWAPDEDIGAPPVSPEGGPVRAG